MKRLAALLLLFSLLLTGSTHAENEQTVTIGSHQIRLGQTSDEVTREVAGSWATKNSNWTFGIWYTHLDGSDDDATDLINGKYYYVSGVSGVSFAGYGKCTFIYSFDKNNILTSVVIVSGMYKRQDKSAALSQFAKLNNALSEKYGSPISTDGMFVSFDNSNYTALQAINECYFTSRSTGLTWYEDPSTSLLNSSQFLVNQGDNTYVDIILMEYDRQSTYVEHNFIKIKSQEKRENSGFVISYSLCTQKEVDAVIDDAKNREDALNSDL